MNRNDILKEMKESVGTKDPIVFFAKFADLFNLLFDKIEKLEDDLRDVKTRTALSIQWDPKVAMDMLTDMVDELREEGDADGNIFQAEIDALKKAVKEGRVTQHYSTFCEFWLETLGWHPFLPYKD